MSWLKILVCDCFGIYERIIIIVKNFFWMLRFYFGILVRVWFIVFKNMLYWIKFYNDNGSLGKVIMVVYLVFVDNYMFIGVVGVDVFFEDLGFVILFDFIFVLL